MRRLWFFRSSTNFVISVLGVSAVGVTVMNIYREDIFSKPIISEAIKTLSQNERVKETLGYPISYSANMANKHSTSKD